MDPLFLSNSILSRLEVMNEISMPEQKAVKIKEDNMTIWVGSIVCFELKGI